MCGLRTDPAKGVTALLTLILSLTLAVTQLIMAFSYLLLRHDVSLYVLYAQNCQYLSILCGFWQMRVRIFRSYISDLTDQNAILVKTVEELEADANVRVARLEAKLQKASSVIKVSHNRLAVNVLSIRTFYN